MSFTVTEITEAEFDALAAKPESHFFEFKSADRFEPVGKTLSAFGNADGGRLIVGVSDASSTRGKFAAYADQESANGHITEIMKMFSTAPDAIEISYLRVNGYPSLILDINVGKSSEVISTPDKRIFVRLNASNQELRGAEAIRQLGWKKGQSSYEDVQTDEPVESLANSEIFKFYQKDLIPKANGSEYIKREKLARDSNSTVAGVLLFDDNPQATVTQGGG